MTIELFKHQQQAVSIARERDRFAFFWDCGTGKTIAMLAAVNELGGRTLVLCPKSIMRSAWVRDAENFPGLRVIVAHGTPDEIRRVLRQPSDVVVTNFETLRAEAKLSAFRASGFHRLIVDESSKIKNPKSQITRAVHVFADSVKSVYLLSGTPAPNNGTEYWGQLRALGKDVAGLYWAWVGAHFIPVKKNVPTPRGRQDVVVGWRQTAEQAARLETLLKANSWSLRKTECLDLPEQMDVIVDVELPAEQADYYAQIRDELRLEAEQGGFDRIRSEAAMMKLRQATGGVVLGPNKERIIVGSAKLEALAELLDEIGPAPVVIWAEFKAEIEAIAEMIADRGE